MSVASFFFVLVTLKQRSQYQCFTRPIHMRRTMSFFSQFGQVGALPPPTCLVMPGTLLTREPRTTRP